MKILNISDIPTYYLEVKGSEDDSGSVDQLVHWYQILLLFSMQELVCIAEAHNAPSWMRHAQQNHTCIKDINMSSNE